MVWLTAILRLVLLCCTLLWAIQAQEPVLKLDHLAEHQEYPLGPTTVRLQVRVRVSWEPQSAFRVRCLSTSCGVTFPLACLSFFHASGLISRISLPQSRTCAPLRAILQRSC